MGGVILEAPTDAKESNFKRPYLIRIPVISMRRTGHLSEAPSNVIFYSQVKIPIYFIEVHKERYLSSIAISTPTIGRGGGGYTQARLRYFFTEMRAPTIKRGR